LVNCSSAASRSSAISPARMSGGGSESVSVKLLSFIQNRSRLSLSRLSSPRSWERQRPSVPCPRGLRAPGRFIALHELVEVDRCRLLFGVMLVGAQVKPSLSVRAQRGLPSCQRSRSPPAGTRCQWADQQGVDGIFGRLRLTRPRRPQRARCPDNHRRLSILRSE
jgi:hypothetical protein